MGKKNLDKLFHEKLKDFSEMPDEKVWQSIETSLNQKKKSRRVIPIWWKLGGVAAVLLIAITFINPFGDSVNDTPTVTDVDSTPEKALEENKTDRTFENQKSNEDQIVDVQEESALDKEEASTNQVANTTSTSKKELSPNVVQESPQNQQTDNQETLGIQIANSENQNVQKATNEIENAVSEKRFDENNQETVLVDSNTSETLLNNNSASENTDTKDNSLFKEMENSEATGITQSENDTENTAKKLKEESKKKSIFDEIEAQEEVIVENTGSKWSAGPSIAPVYYDAMGEGSPVHSIFVPNSKSGDVNLSYGLSVAYEVNKKLSIRSGIHKVNFGYRTDDVEFTSSLESTASGQIDNINYALTSKNLVVSSKANVGTEAFNQDSSLDNLSSSSDVSAVSASRVGTMEQSFGYLEIPVELNYALINKKFGINLIGGVSSLFLVDNSISLNSGELTTEMGEANNVNAVNFSTNVGFGMNYKFTSKVQFNIEPVFKYQLNTFSETDGTFNPFSVGVYSGLTFKF